MKGWGGGEGGMGGGCMFVCNNDPSIWVSLLLCFPIMVCLQSSKCRLLLLATGEKSSGTSKITPVVC